LPSGVAVRPGRVVIAKHSKLFGIVREGVGLMGAAAFQVLG
jgi:hypothetical protein